jgi:hypothetical protein
MSDQPEPSPVTSPSAPAADPQESAVDRCARAWKRTCELASLLPKKERHEKEYDRFVDRESSRAFRDAMPPLIGFQNIQDYIGCVAYAQLHDIFTVPECQRLFDTAKFALTVVCAEPKTIKIRNLP